MRPAENVFSRYSTVSGKKSSPSFADREDTAATSSIVSPYLITTEPSACLATLPVSTISSLLPSLIDSFKYFFVVISIKNGTPEHTVKLYRPALTLRLILTRGSRFSRILLLSRSAIAANISSQDPCCLVARRSQPHKIKGKSKKSKSPFCLLPFSFLLLAT